MAEDANAKIRVDIDTAAALANIKNLQRQISAFHTSMAKGGAAAAATSLNLQQGLLNSINQTGQFSATIKNVKSTTESFTNALEKNKLSMREYFRYSAASTKTFGRFFSTEFDTINKVARERVKDLQTQYIRMGRDANGAIKAIAVRPLVLDMENLSTKTQIASQRQALLNQMLKQGSTNLLNFGKNTQWAGRQLMVGFTIPLMMFGTVAVKTFMDMEKQAIRFKRVYGEMFTTTEQTNKAFREIKDLANEFTKYGVAVEKTMELAADIAATGKMGADLTAQVANATRLAVLGGVEQSEALKATISLTDAFGTSAEQLAGKIDFLNAVENQTVTSIEDLTIAIPKAGPVVQQLGGDVQDLTFFLTAMREGGINASEGANALKSGLASMINPTGKAAEMLQGFGINLKGIVDANKGNVKGIVTDFAKALDTLDPLNRAQAIEQLFGKFQFARLSTLFQNVIKEGNQASRVLKLANATTAELAILSERELKKVEDSPMFKFQKAIEDIKVTLVPLGEAFLKAVTPVLEFGTKILEKFNELDAGAKQFVVGLTAIGGVIGPVFLMGFGLVANGVANLVKMFVFFKTALNKAGSASTELGVSTDYMTQQQLEANSVAASLNQIHQKLTQTFTSETAAINNLTVAYRKALAVQSGVTGGAIGRTRAPKKYASGVISVPGPKGAGDVVPAMLSPGEAVIPAKQSKKYRGIISSLISDNVPGFRFGRNPFGSMLNRSNVAVRMKDQDFISSLRQGGKDARYKSAFETQTGADYINPSGSKTTRQRDLRSAMERDVFGLDPKTTSPSSRPTYGYAKTSILSSFINRLFGLKGKNFNSSITNIGDSLDKYGNIDLVTKGSVAKRSSAFPGDALVNYNWATQANTSRRIPDLDRIIQNTGIRPAPMRGASPEQLKGFDRLGLPFGSNKVPGTNQYSVNPKPAYIETYTPGGFSFKEIDKVIVNNPRLAKQLKEELRAAGLGGVRVTGSNFAARLFKGLGIPGYRRGSESIPAMGPLTRAQTEAYERLKDQEISQIRKTTRGATDPIRTAHSGLTYSNAQTEIDDFIRVYEEQAKADGVPQKTIDSAIEKYRRSEVSHLTKDTRTVMIDGTPVEVKNWRSGNLVRDFGAVNQIISHIDQTNARDAKGKPIPGKSLISTLDPKEIAAASGISEREAKKELRKLGRGEHPVTASSSKVLMAVADKYLQVSDSTSAKARIKALKHILNQRIADGSFFAAANSGQLSLPQNQRAAFDQEELRKQDQYLEGKKSGLAKSRSGIITSTSGEAKTSKTKRKGGKPKDTRLLLTSPGEAVLSEKSTDAIKKGGVASIPGIGAVTRMGRFGPIKVAGAYEGDPAGQTQDEAPRTQKQRDPVTGRFVSSKAQETVTQPTKQKPGIGLGGVGMIGAGAVMAGSMVPGQIGEISQQLMMPVMALSMIAPLMKNLSPVFLGLLAAAGALTAGIINFAVAADRGRKEGISLAQAMTLTNEKLIELSKITGTVSATEARQKEQADRLSSVNNAQASDEADILLQSEFGQKFLEEAKSVAKSMPSPKIAAQAFASQLSSAVAQGVITTDQAKALGEKIGQELESKEFSIETVATINRILGPRGENLEKEPLKVLLDIQKIQQGQVDAAFQTASAGQGSIVNPETVGKAGLGAVGVTKGTIDFASGKAANAAAKEAVDVATKQAGKIGAGLAGKVLAKIGIGAAASATGVGAIAGIPLMLLGVAELAAGGWAIYEAFAAAGKIQEENNRLNSMALTLGMQQIVNNEQLLDSLNSQYDAKEAELEAQIAAETNVNKRKKLETELSDIIAKRASDTSALNSANADVMASVLENAKGLGLEELKSKALEQNAVTNANDIFKRDATALAIEGISKLENQDDLESQLILSVTMGVIPTEVASLLALASQENPQVGVEYMALVSTRGTAEANEITALLAAGGVDKDGTKFPILLEYMQTGDIDAVAELIKLRTYGIEIDLDVNGEERIARAAETLKDLENQPDVITMKIATDIDDAKGDVYEKIMKEWQSQVGPEGVLSLPALSTVSLLVPEVTITQVNEYLAARGIYSNMLTTEQKLALYSIPVAIDLAGIDKGGNVPKSEIETPKPTGTRKSDPLDNLLKSLQNVRKATIDSQGKVDELFKLFEKGKNISVFKGIENQLIGLSSNLDFINFISSLDKAEQGLFFTMEKGNLVLTKRGRLTEKGFNAKAVGDFVLAQQKVVLSSQNELKARNLLIKAGYKYTEAVELSRDADIQAALASAAATEGKKKRKKAIEDVTNALRNGLAAQKSLLTAEEQFESLYEKIQDKIDADSTAIELKFKLDTAADDKIIRDAESKIAGIRYKIDDQEAGLTLISDKEEVINEKYDKRLDALDKIKSVNDSISQQQRNQLSLADALSSGDIGAAAAAMQKIQEDFVNQSSAKQRDLVEKARQQELLKVSVSINGELKTREQIEKTIKDLQKEIFDLEEKSLEPAEERNRLLAEQRDSALLKLDTERDKWEAVRNRIDLAKTATEDYAKALAAANALAVIAISDNKSPVTPTTPTTPADGSTPTGNTFKGTRPGPDREGKKGEVWVGPEATWKHDGTKWNKISDVGQNNQKPPVSNTNTNTGNPDKVTKKEQADALKRQVAANEKLIGDQLAIIRGTTSALTTAADRLGRAKNALSRVSGTPVGGSTLATLRSNVTDAQKAYDKLINDRNVASGKANKFAKDNIGLNKQISELGFRSGGFVSGPGTATSDSVPAMLSNGEYVIRASSVNKFGESFLDNINAGVLPGYRKGGIVNPDRLDGQRDRNKPTPRSTSFSAADMKTKAFKSGDLAREIYAIKKEKVFQDIQAKQQSAFNQARSDAKQKVSAPVVPSTLDKILDFGAKVSPFIAMMKEGLDIAKSAGNVGKGKATPEDYMVLGLGALNFVPGGGVVSKGVKTTGQLSKIIPGFTKFKGNTQASKLKEGSDEALELEEYVKRPLFLHNNRNNAPGSRVDRAIMENKYTIPQGSDIVRIANVKDMEALALTKPGQSFVLDRFMSVTSKNSSEFLEGMRTGRLDTGGRSSVVGNYPLLRFNVKTDVPGIYDINKILPGQAPSNVVDGLLARGQNLKVRKITTDKKTGQLIYDIDLGTNIRAKTGLNQKQSQTWSDNLREAVRKELGKTSERTDFFLGGWNMPQQMPRYYAAGGMVKPKYFNAGGFAVGTDTIPSMLTPGEFVVQKRAVENFGVDNLSAINSGTSLNDSVYNYSINVNVKTDANADQIAKTVMTQIKQIDSQRIRGVGLR
jgi:TP901 family phage tail tape measure protein